MMSKRFDFNHMCYNIFCVYIVLIFLLCTKLASFSQLRILSIPSFLQAVS